MKTFSRKRWIVLLAVGMAVLSFSLRASPRGEDLGGVASNVSLSVGSSPGAGVDAGAAASVALIAASTLISEDLTCIAAGLMAAGGRISFLLGAFACFAGILAGDVLLFLAGRWLGRPALRRAPLRWFVNEQDVDRSSAWLERRGFAVITASRFLPGARLPAYFAAGLLNTSFWRFSLYFAIAAAVWTPMLVGFSAVVGGGVARSTLFAGQSLIIKLTIGAAAIYAAANLGIKLSSRYGRRMLLSSWRRLTRWEFWPPWAFYPPVVCYALVLGFRHRGLTLFTAANPGIPAGGFIGESKIQIMRGLGSEDARKTPSIAKTHLISDSLAVEARIQDARRFLSENKLALPVVLKPDQGQRGSGVVIVRSDDELECCLSRARTDTIIQEYVPGAEFGVFYFRRPGDTRGEVFSITEKRMPFVEGDGRRTLEQLILEDSRAVCMARFLLKQHQMRLSEVPRPHNRVQLVELGTHCRGAMFLDGIRLKTAALEERFDQLSKRFEGFYLGRFDVRAPSAEAFSRGEFKVIELNGVTSEATHIYDPGNGLFDAYRTLFLQWRLAFEIGAENRCRGFAPAPLSALIESLVEYRRRAKFHLS